MNRPDRLNLIVLTVLMNVLLAACLYWLHFRFANLWLAHLVCALNGIAAVRLFRATSFLGVLAATMFASGVTLFYTGMIAGLAPLQPGEVRKFGNGFGAGLIIGLIMIPNAVLVGIPIGLLLKLSIDFKDFRTKRRNQCE